MNPKISPSATQAFLNQHNGLFFTLSSVVGLVCGALSVATNSLHPEPFPFLDLSVGLYVVPPLLVGWVALYPSLAAFGGLATYLAAVLGHLVATYLTAENYNMLEYSAWFPLALVIGPLLGMSGNMIRSHRTMDRVCATGFPLSLMAVFLGFGLLGQVNTEGSALHLGVLLLDGALMLVILALCRGWKVRIGSLGCTIVLSIPAAFALLYLFLFVWRASGDY